MAVLLVIQPDRRQADALRLALHSHVAETLVIAESLDAALESIDSDVPDVILLPTLIPAAVEDYLLAYLGAMPRARHVQILGVPLFERAAPPVQPIQRWRWLFPWRRPPAARVAPVESCDPGIFTQDVVAYLASVRASRNIESYAGYAMVCSDAQRRTERRFEIDEVPWISAGVRLGGERAGLVNVSAHGALMRTHIRPEHRLLRRADSYLRTRPRLVFELESEGEIQAVGRVLRCLPLDTDGDRLYEVAFAFDDAVGLHLPSAALERIGPRASRGGAPVPT